MKTLPPNMPMLEDAMKGIETSIIITIIEDLTDIRMIDLAEVVDLTIDLEETEMTTLTIATDAQSV